MARQLLRQPQNQDAANALPKQGEAMRAAEFQQFSKLMKNLRYPRGFTHSANTLAGLYASDRETFLDFWCRYSRESGHAERAFTTRPAKDLDEVQWRRDHSFLHRELSRSPQLSTLVDYLGYLAAEQGPETESAQRLLNIFAEAEKIRPALFMAELLLNGGMVRGAPHSEREIRSILLDRVAKSEKMEIYAWWGGYKESPKGVADESDENALRVLSEMQRKLKEAYPLASVRILFSDIHAIDFSGRSLEDSLVYQSSLSKQAAAHGLKIVPLSELYREQAQIIAPGIMSGIQSEERAQAQELMNKFPVQAQRIEAAAERHSEIVQRGVRSSREMALQYVSRRRTESRMLKMSHPNALYLSFGDPEREAIVSDLPTAYLNPKSMKSDLPWYSEPEPPKVRARLLVHRRKGPRQGPVFIADPVAERAGLIFDTLASPAFCRDAQLVSHDTSQEARALKALAREAALDRLVSPIVIWGPTKRSKSGLADNADELAFDQVQSLANVLRAVGVDKVQVTILFDDISLSFFSRASKAGYVRGDMKARSDAYFQGLQHLAERRGFNIMRLSHLYSEWVPQAGPEGKRVAQAQIDSSKMVPIPERFDRDKSSLLKTALERGRAFSSILAEDERVFRQFEDMALHYGNLRHSPARASALARMYLKARASDLYFLSLLSEKTAVKSAAPFKNALLLSFSDPEWQVIASSRSSGRHYQIGVPAFRCYSGENQVKAPWQTSKSILDAEKMLRSLRQRGVRIGAKGARLQEHDIDDIARACQLIEEYFIDSPNAAREKARLRAKALGAVIILLNTDVIYTGTLLKLKKALLRGRQQKLDSYEFDAILAGVRAELEYRTLKKAEASPARLECAARYMGIARGNRTTHAVITRTLDPMFETLEADLYGQLTNMALWQGKGPKRFQEFKATDITKAITALKEYSQKVPIQEAFATSYRNEILSELTLIAGVGPAEFARIIRRIQHFEREAQKKEESSNG